MGKEEATIPGKGSKEGRTRRYADVTARISEILVRLHAGEVLSMKELAEEFGVSLRTIQRDVNDRLATLPLERDGERFWLRTREVAGATLSPEETAVLELLDELSRRQGMEFYAKAHRLLGRIRQIGMENPYYTKLDMEDVSDKLHEMSLLEQAIRSRRLVHCRYRMPRGTYEIDIKPLKIATFDGFWYLLALDARNDILKKYLIRRIGEIRLEEERFEVDPSIEKEIRKAMKVWFEAGTEPFEVHLYAEPAIAHYFRVKPLAPTQSIEGEDPDGGLEILIEATHEMEVLPVVKYWLPRLKIMEPDWLQQRLVEDLEDYLREVRGKK